MYALQALLWAPFAYHLTLPAVAFGPSTVIVPILQKRKLMPGRFGDEPCLQD